MQKHRYFLRSCLRRPRFLYNYYCLCHGLTLYFNCFYLPMQIHVCHSCHNRASLFTQNLSAFFALQTQDLRYFNSIRQLSCACRVAYFVGLVERFFYVELQLQIESDQFCCCYSFRNKSHGALTAPRRILKAPLHLVNSQGGVPR